MTESLVPELANKPFVGFLEKSLGSKDLEILPLAGDASQRRYYRVVHAATDTWVLMQWEPFEDSTNYPFLSVQNLFLTSNIQVPEVIDISPGEGLILLEDLGDLTLERKFWEHQNQELILPYYKLAIDELIKIHYATASAPKDSSAFKTEFTLASLQWEMNYAYENLLLRYCRLKLSHQEQDQLKSIFFDICNTLSKEPKVVCHRDYHSRNLMLKLNRMRVIDFQDARLGPVQYDLVSLLKDSYVEIAPQMAETLIGYYREQAQTYGHSFDDLEHFMNLYELQSIQRCFKACGSFSSFFNMRRDLRYLKYLRPTIRRVHESLSHFPKYKMFQDLLNDYGLLDWNFDDGTTL